MDRVVTGVSHCEGRSRREPLHEGSLSPSRWLGLDKLFRPVALHSTGSLKTLRKARSSWVVCQQVSSCSVVRIGTWLQDLKSMHL